MIRKLRKRHLWMQPLLGVIALGGLAFAIQGRASIPAESGDAISAASTAPLSVEGFAQMEELPIYAKRDGAQRLLLRATDSLQKPDVLVYLSPETSAVTNGKRSLGKQVQLLGALQGAREQEFTLDSQTADETIIITLYSLAHQEVLAEAQLPGSR